MVKDRPMLTVRSVDTRNLADRRRFLRLPFALCRDQPLWVPPIKPDAELQLNRARHPFYEHSDADFFVAERDGEMVGRVAALENKPYNAYHGTRQAQFYLFECVDNREVASALFERVFDWARARGLNRLVGPKGFGPLDGYGLLVEGFEHRPAMTMMNYNPAYYPVLLDGLGFQKEVDFVSCYLGPDFRMPERVHRIAERVQKRGELRVHTFPNKRALMRHARRIGEAYNQAFVHNWEYYPLTDREVEFVAQNVLVVADPKLIKLILHGDDIVGFLFGFPDVSAALQRCGGNVYSWRIVDLLLEFRRTRWIALNGAGLLPEFQGRGGNALLYSEMERTIRDSGRFVHADLTQIAETAAQMRQDLISLGGKPYKNHRVYGRDL
jgi:GNAT superfamily N-acetyltransferase